MADGLFNLAGGRTVELTKDGRTYRLTLRTLGDYAKKEEAMLLRVGSPYDGIESIRDDATRKQAIKIAADVAARPQIATMDDEERFDTSFRGVAFGLWRALCRNHPEEFPPEASIEKGIQLGMDFIAWFGDVAELVRAMNRVEEKDIVKNSAAENP